MNDDPHIIEIDRIVLTGTGRHRPERLRLRIEAEVRRALVQAGLPRGVAEQHVEGRVAGEVAGSVVRAVRGGGR
jgi:hypothetical protein